jgi:hypothetical protein
MPLDCFGENVVRKEWKERTNSDHALRESEERLQFALNGPKGGLWDWDVSTGKA